MIWYLNSLNLKTILRPRIVGGMPLKRTHVVPSLKFKCSPQGYQWEGRCLRLKTSTFKPCHIMCQLGLALDNVDGVGAGLLEPTFSRS